MERNKRKFKIGFIKNVKDAIHGYIGFTPLEVFIIDSPIFQRLRNISQVPFGSMVYPSHSVKRFEHSIGTMHLAGRFIEVAFLNSEEKTKKDFLKEFIVNMKAAISDDPDKYNLLNFLKESSIAPAIDSDDIEPLFENKDFLDSLKNIIIQLTRIMGLLHDIGHLPFSHLGEEIIEVVIKNNKIMKEEEKEEIITKISPLYSSINKEDKAIYPIHELNSYHIATKLLREYVDIEPNDLTLELKFYICLLKKSMNKKEIEIYKAFKALLGIIDNDIDADRADYFLRDGTTSGIGVGSYDLERLVNSMLLVKTAGLRDFIVRPNTAAVSAVETFITERSKLHRWLYFHPIIILFETCFIKLLELIVNKYKYLNILEPFYTPESYQVIPSFIHPESDIITRIKNQYLTINKKPAEEINGTDKLFLTLYNVLYFKHKACRPIWQKQGDYYINFHARIVDIANRERKVEVGSEDIYKFFRNLAENLDKSKELQDILEKKIGGKYFVMVTSKRFKSLKTKPTDTGEHMQYVIVGKEFLSDAQKCIGIDEYPPIKAIEESWYKEIPINIFIVTKDGTRISRNDRDKLRKEIEEYFVDTANKTLFSLTTLIEFSRRK